MTNGVDVSHWQQAVDWPRVGEACDFALVKATQGSGIIDPMFATNRRGVVANVKVPGAYHFATPGDPVAQARFFFSVAGRLPLMGLDLEEEDPVHGLTWRSRGVDPQLFATGFLAELRSLAGGAILYTGPGFIAEYGINQTAYALWLAEYSDVPHPAPWPQESIWQFTETGSVPGVPRPCDQNRSSLTVAQLLALGGSTPIPAPSPQPEVEVLDPTDPIVKQILANQQNTNVGIVRLAAALAADQSLDANTKRELDSMVASWGPHIDALPT